MTNMQKKKGICIKMVTLLFASAMITISLKKDTKFLHKYTSINNGITDIKNDLDNLIGNIIIPSPSCPTTPITTPLPSPTPEIVEEKKLVALTFDDGPYGECTEDLAGLLWEYDVKCTFFVLKDRVDKTPNVLTQLYGDGHEIAIHGATHTNLTKLSVDGINDEIESTIDSIEYLGITATNLVRPPYGSINDQMKENIEYPFILWNIDTRDWETHDKDKIKEVIMENIEAGAIILMHDRKDVHECNMQALEELLPILTEEYKFVTVSELAEYYGISLENGKVYRKIKTN